MLTDTTSFPADPSERAAWLQAREDAIAVRVVANLRRIVVDAFTGYVNTMVASGDMGALDAIPGTWMVYVTNELSDDLGATHLAGAMSAWVGMPTPPTPALASAWETVVNDNAVSYVGTATNRLKGVGDQTWQAVRGQVQAGVQAGLTIPEMTAKVQEAGQFAASRAETIARTETIGAYINGDMGGAQALGDKGPVEKVWRATSDARTRPSHIEASGQVRAFNEDFDVGGIRMSHPHADGAPAGEVVNCRCYVEFLYANDKRPDGSLVPPPARPAPAPAPAPATPAATKPAPTARFARIDAAAERYGVDRQAVIARWDDVPVAQARIKREAAERSYESLKFLDGFEGIKLRRPSAARAGGEYDALKGLSKAERGRLSRWFDDSPSSAPDLMLHRAQSTGFMSDSASVDDMIETWLYHTRVVDSAASLRSGRIPNPDRFGGFDIGDVLTETTREGMDYRQLIGATQQDGAGYLASQVGAEEAEWAYRILSPNAITGSKPWQMTFQSWHEEVMDLEYALSQPGVPAREVVTRYRDLVPEVLDQGQDFESLYAAIVETAKVAELEVPANAVIPWAT